MQYDGSPQQYEAPTSNYKAYNPGTNPYGYTNDTPPRTGSSDNVDMPGWTTMAPQTQPAYGGFASPNPNPNRKSAASLPFHRTDVVSRHLLVETALLDSQNFELLAIEEVDALKKEKVQLEARIESARRKLALESKVRDAAQSLHRLYQDDPKGSKGLSNVSPTSPKKARASFLDNKSKEPKQRNISNGQIAKTINQAGDELAVSQKKIDDILQILSGLESRRQYVESRLLRHTAAVLQLCHHEHSDTEAKQRASSVASVGADRNLLDNTIQGFLNGSGYEESIYSRNSGEVNGFGGAFGGMPKKRALDRVSNEKLISLQSRVDGMNSQMRNLIQLVRREKTTPREDDLYQKGTARSGEDGIAHLENQVDLVDKNVARLEEECLKVRDERERTEAQLTEINKQMYLVMQVSDPMSDVQAPPATSAHGVQGHLNYLEEIMLSMEDVLQSKGGQSAQEVEEAQKKIDQYEMTMTGLWEIISSQNGTKEPFSLQGFSTRVQHTFDKAMHMDQQADILRKQIQQQRELNSKSDGEKDKQLQDLRSTRAEMDQRMNELRERHVTAEAEAHGARSELENVIRELENFRQTAKSHEDQKHQVLEQLQKSNSRSQQLEKAVAEYEAQLGDLQDDARLTTAEAEAKFKDHDGKVQSLARELAETRALHMAAAAKMEAKHKEAEDLEAEVVRLTTELTMARAELDGAYGSRAERAKEVATAEIEELRKERDAQAEQIKELMSTQQSGGNARMADLERELADMAEDYQEITRESVAVEKEREQLENLVDGLRERCETLETQLSDEKVRWLGISSPTAVNGDSGREMTSAMILRNEFKKMMRETRAESARLLRAEQEERKKLESMVRQLRRDNVPNKNGLAPR
ncbi:hypothetical protein KVT40_004055 [Elsinoe batatas]|uniref:Up-regulated during septation protein 1 domain-containing protein n=1 Tax=Elsinoe batatas TaxID=2601811 RepID=A0A8K0L384_9PEZI|nr:hypothetical protein KVT40_004055 [Elsinoe batatas]